MNRVLETKRSTLKCVIFFGSSNCFASIRFDLLEQQDVNIAKTAVLLDNVEKENGAGEIFLCGYIL